MMVQMMNDVALFVCVYVCICFAVGLVAGAVVCGRVRCCTRSVAVDYGCASSSSASASASTAASGPGAGVMLSQMRSATRGYQSVAQHDEDEVAR